MFNMTSLKRLFLLVSLAVLLSVSFLSVASNGQHLSTIRQQNDVGPKKQIENEENLQTLTEEEKKFWTKLKTSLQKFNQKSALPTIWKNENIKLKRLYSKRRKETLLPQKNQKVIKHLKDLFKKKEKEKTGEDLFKLLEHQAFLQNTRQLLKRNNLVKKQIDVIKINEKSYHINHLPIFVKDDSKKLDKNQESIQLENLIKGGITSQDIVTVLRRLKRALSLFASLKKVLRQFAFFSNKVKTDFSIVFLNKEYDLAVFTKKTQSDTDKREFEEFKNVQNILEELVDNRMSVRKITSSIKKSLIQNYWDYIRNGLDEDFTFLPTNLIQIKNKKYFVRRLFEKRKDEDFLSLKRKTRRQLHVLLKNKVLLEKLLPSLEEKKESFKQQFWKDLGKFLQEFAKLEFFDYLESLNNKDKNKINQNKGFQEILLGNYDENLVPLFKVREEDSLKDSDTTKSLEFLIEKSIAQIWKSIYQSIRNYVKENNFPLESVQDPIFEFEAKVKQLFWKKLTNTFRHFKDNDKKLPLSQINGYSLDLLFKNRKVNEFVKLDDQTKQQFKRLYDDNVSLLKIESDLLEADSFLEEIFPNKPQNERKPAYWKSLREKLKNFVGLLIESVLLDENTEYNIEHLLKFSDPTDPKYKDLKYEDLSKEALVQLESLLSDGVTSEELQTVLLDVKKQLNDFYQELKPYLKVFTFLEELPNKGEIQLETENFKIDKLFEEIKNENSEGNVPVSDLQDAAIKQLWTLLEVDIDNKLIKINDYLFRNIKNPDLEKAKDNLQSFYWKELKKIFVKFFVALPVKFYNDQGHRIDRLFDERELGEPEFEDEKTKADFQLFSPEFLPWKLAEVLDKAYIFLQQQHRTGTSSSLEGDGKSSSIQIDQEFQQANQLRANYWSKLQKVLKEESLTVFFNDPTTSDTFNHLFSEKDKESVEDLNEDALKQFDMLIIDQFQPDNLQRFPDDFWTELKIILIKYKFLNVDLITLQEEEYLEELFALVRSDATTTYSSFSDSQKEELLKLFDASVKNPKILDEIAKQLDDLSKYWNEIKTNIIRDDNFYVDDFEILFPVRNIEVAGETYDLTPFQRIDYRDAQSGSDEENLTPETYRLLKKLFDNKVKWKEDISDQLYSAMNSFWNQLKLILKPFNKIPYFLSDEGTFSSDRQIYWALVELLPFKNDRNTVFSRLETSNTYRGELLGLLQKDRWTDLLETIRSEFDTYEQILKTFWKTFSYFLSRLPVLPQQQVRDSENKVYSVVDVFASRQTKFDDLNSSSKEWLEGIVFEDILWRKAIILGHAFWWWIRPTLVSSKASPTLIMFKNKYLNLENLFAFAREKKQPDSKDRPEWFFFQTIIALFPNYWELDFSLLKTEIEKIDQFWNSLRNVFAAFAALPKIDTNLIINDELQFSIDAFVDLFQEVKNDLNATGILSSENKNAQNILHTLFYDRSDPTTSLQKKITAIETFLFSNYWSQMVAVFNEYEFLPKKVFPNQIDNLSLKTLFQNRAFADTWKEEQNTLQKITSQFTIDELQTSIDQKLNSFWLELKVILKSAKSTKKKNKVVVGEQEYSLFNLLEQTDTTTSGSEMTGEARKELLLLLQDGVDEKDLKLVLLDKNELLAQTKNKSLALGLGAMGGLVGVTGLGGFVFWLVKRR